MLMGCYALIFVMFNWTPNPPRSPHRLLTPSWSRGRLLSRFTAVLLPHLRSLLDSIVSRLSPTMQSNEIRGSIDLTIYPKSRPGGLASEIFTHSPSDARLELTY